MGGGQGWFQQRGCHICRAGEGGIAPHSPWTGGCAHGAALRAAAASAGGAAGSGAAAAAAAAVVASPAAAAGRQVCSLPSQCVPQCMVSLMGNQIDRITHLNYSELPTGDPSGIEKDELRVGVAYFFSDDEDELDERGAPPPEKMWREPGPAKDGSAGAVLLLGELEYSAFCCHECILSKLGCGQDLSAYPLSTLLPRCRAGDLLELVPAHWVVYVGASRVIHLQGREIREEHLAQVSAGRAGRIVNTWYRYRALPADLVVHNARGHVGLQGHQVCWTNSESFAAWCRFGKREFKAGGEAGGQGDEGPLQEGRYLLKLHLPDSRVHTLNFPSLEDLIREKRRQDAGGKVGVLKELSVLNHK
ncbi:LOW QUALITY PROTEIN: protein LRATD1 [Rhinoraja longicauda]